MKIFENFGQFRFVDLKVEFLNGTSVMNRGVEYKLFTQVSFKTVRSKITGLACRQHLSVLDFVEHVNFDPSTNFSYFTSLDSGISGIYLWMKETHSPQFSFDSAGYYEKYEYIYL